MAARPPNRPAFVLRLVLYALAAIFPLLYAAPRTSIYPRSLLPDMVQGTAHRPYVKRVMVPWLVRAADAVTPPSLDAALSRATESSPWLSRRLRWESAHATWFALAFAIHGVSLVVFGFGMERLARACLGARGIAAALVGAGTVFLVPIHFGYQNFLYDFPSLASFAWGLAFLHERAWPAYYALFPLGLLNKETYVLMMVAYVFHEWGRRPLGELVRHVAAQFAISVAVLGALAVGYARTPGETVEFHLWRNLAYRPPPKQLRRDAIYWGFTLFGVVGGWSLAVARRPLFGIGAILLGTTFVLGYMGEYRDFYEAYPYLALMAAHAVMSRLGRGIATPEAPRTAA